MKWIVKHNDIKTAVFYTDVDASDYVVWMVQRYSHSCDLSHFTIESSPND